MENNKKELQLLSYISEIVARKISEYIGRDLGIECHIHVEKFEVLSCEEFLRSIPVPTFISSFTWLDEGGLFEMEPRLLYNGLLKHQSIRVEEPDGFELSVFREIIVKPAARIISKAFCDSLSGKSV